MRVWLDTTMNLSHGVMVELAPIYKIYNCVDHHSPIAFSLLY